MADGVDATGGVQEEKHTTDPRKQEAAEPCDPPVEESSPRKKAKPSRKGQLRSADVATSLQHPGSGKEAHFSESGSGRACKLSHEVTLQAVLNDTNLQIHGCLSKNAQCFKHADRPPASLPIAATYRRLKHKRIIGVEAQATSHRSLQGACVGYQRINI